MRGQAVVLAITLIGAAAPAAAQSDNSAAEPRTAEEFLETARETYSVAEAKFERCPAPSPNEIVVCRERLDPATQRLASPTDRAYAAGQAPPDPIPSAPNVDGPGIFQGKGITMGTDPEPIYIIDLSALPEPLTPEEAALVRRAEDPPSPEAASPAAVP
jgi:hypothetical protein